MMKQKITLYFSDEGISVTAVFPNISNNIITMYLENENTFGYQKTKLNYLKVDNNDEFFHSKKTKTSKRELLTTKSIKDLEGTDFDYKENEKLVDQLVVIVKKLTDENKIEYKEVELVYSQTINEDVMYKLEQSIKKKFCVKDCKYSKIDERIMLAIDAGTGFYACSINAVAGLSSQKLCQFSVNKNQELKEEAIKQPSSIYINPTYFDKLSKDIQNRNIANILTYENTRLSSNKEEDIYNFLQFHHYKRYIYYLAQLQDIVFNTWTVSSNIQFTENGVTIDILHLFIILFLQIQKTMETKYQRIDIVKIAVPISAKEKHFDFMTFAVRYVFSKVEINFITEPEAAFSGLLNKELNKYEQVVMLDGGDGTFDCLCVMRSNYQNEIAQQWSRQEYDAFNVGGSLIYDTIYNKIKEKIFQQFDNDEIQLLAHRIFKSFRKAFEVKDNIEITQANYQDLESKAKVQEFEYFNLSSCGINALDDLQDNDPRHHLFLKNYENLFILQSKQQQKIEQYITDQKFDKKFCTDFQITPKQDFVKEILEKTNIFQEKAEYFMRRIDLNKKTKIMMVGGLFNNALIAYKTIQMINKLDTNKALEQIRVKDAQIVIQNGIPITRANICMHNTFERTKYNLYILISQNKKIKINEQDIDLQNIKMKINNDQYVKPQTYFGQISNVPDILIHKNQFKSPENNKFTNELLVPIGAEFDISFFRTSHDAPPFLPIHSDTSNNYFDETNIFTYQLYIDPKDFENRQKLSDISIQHNTVNITVKIQLNFKYIEQKSQPVIEIYVLNIHGEKNEKNNNLILYKTIDNIWDWFENDLLKDDLQFEILE